MKFRKKQSEKKDKLKKVNANEKVVNVWDVINENFTNINVTCENLEKSLQTLSTNTNLMNEKLKSQATTSKKIIDDTVDNLRETKNNLKKVKNNNTTNKRNVHLVKDTSKKIPSLPFELPN